MAVRNYRYDHMQNIYIRKVSITDLDTLARVSRTTFYETFHDTNTKENLYKYLNESFHPDKLTEEILNPLSEFYFAVTQEQVVGYLKVNRGDAQTEFKDPAGFEIERIYILQAYLGKSIGQTLLDYSLTLAAQYNCSFAWLGVWENNFRAIRFYQKNGFVIFNRHVFPVGDDPQIDLLMRRMI
jgi:diamine N-acetyltransferase